MVDPKRTYRLNTYPLDAAPVVYWMQRDQRVRDNWALIFAVEKAIEMQQPLCVVFCLAGSFLGASQSHFKFMQAGLAEVDVSLMKLNIPFFLIHSRADLSLPAFISENHVGCLVTDFNPVKPVVAWKEKIRKEIKVPFIEVDAHNILPCRDISHKAEFSAMHLRNRITRRLPEFLDEFPELRPLRAENLQQPWRSVDKLNRYDYVGDLTVNGYHASERAAGVCLEKFLKTRLSDYDRLRNDPNENGQSGLSPYLHFGQISAQRVALEVSRMEGLTEPRKSFLEELIVRRELADNFCHYNSNYDTFDGFHPWAKATLNDHRCDSREYLYSADQFRNAATHDQLWNAAQHELVNKGKMHGFLRMYWAKKILEWTASPEEAMEIAIELNDSFSFDGRDPNGYAGIAWSIGGVHDRAWGERQVFGKIRYMNFQGCKRKFDVEKYIQKNR